MCVQRWAKKFLPPWHQLTCVLRTAGAERSAHAVARTSRFRETCWAWARGGGVTPPVPSRRSKPAIVTETAPVSVPAVTLVCSRVRSRPSVGEGGEQARGKLGGLRADRT
jgi:hypothetical protein